MLVRRGGYAIGLIDGTEVTVSKCGTRYVQGKTKAGGWSQQRYARRRAQQADALASAAAGRAIDNVLGDRRVPAYAGGDRALVQEAVAASRTPPELVDRRLETDEPRRSSLDRATRQVRSVPIRLNALA